MRITIHNPHRALGKRRRDMSEGNRAMAMPTETRATHGGWMLEVNKRRQCGVGWGWFDSRVFSWLWMGGGID